MTRIALRTFVWPAPKTGIILIFFQPNKAPTETDIVHFAAILGRKWACHFPGHEMCFVGESVHIRLSDEQIMAWVSAWVRLTERPFSALTALDHSVKDEPQQPAPHPKYSRTKIPHPPHLPIPKTSFSHLPHKSNRIRLTLTLAIDLQVHSLPYYC